MRPDVFDFDVGVSVSEPVTATGRVNPSQLPAVRVARTVYHGGYEGLGPAWRQLPAWIRANGHQPAAGLWEFYAKGPGVEHQSGRLGNGAEPATLAS